MKSQKNAQAVISIVILIAIILVWFVSGSRLLPPLSNLFHSPSPTPTPPKADLYPSGWQQQETSDGTLLKLQKDQQDYDPTLVLLQTQPQEDIVNPQQYTDRLVSGARSTLPSLRFTSDQTDDQAGFYHRSLDGFYYYRQQQIFLSQDIYIDTSSNTVYTLTASHLGQEEIKSEIDQINSVVLQEYILN